LLKVYIILILELVSKWAIFETGGFASTVIGLSIDCFADKAELVNERAH
jgi:hypothetical protein